MKKDKFIENLGEYKVALQVRENLDLKLFQSDRGKLSPVEQRALDWLNEAIPDFERRRDAMLMTLDLMRQGFAGWNHLDAIVDRRLDAKAIPLAEDVERGISRPMPLTQITFDFYFSQTEALLFSLETRVCFNELSTEKLQARSLLTTWFKESLYTHMTPTGGPKPTAFPDYVWVGTGTLIDTRMRGKWFEEPTLQPIEQ